MFGCPRKPLYSVKEVRAKLKSIDATLDEILPLPAQHGADGVYASFAGRVNDLQKERAVWEARLKEAEAYDDWLHGEDYRAPGQGPDIILE